MHLNLSPSRTRLIATDNIQNATELNTNCTGNGDSGPQRESTGDDTPLSRGDDNQRWSTPWDSSPSRQHLESIVSNQTDLFLAERAKQT